MSKIQVNNVVRDMTAEELAQKQTDDTFALSQQQAYETAQAQAEANKVSGNAKLLALGLSQEEATALTGYKPQA